MRKPTYLRAGSIVGLGILLALGGAAFADDPPPKKSAAPPAKAAPAKAAPAPAGAHPAPPGAPHPGEVHPGEHPGEHFDHPRYEYHTFHDRDFHHFGPEEAARWRGGYWHNEWHDGRYGWWWMVDGIWYFYDTPVYPHPLIVSEVVYREPVVVEAAPVVVAPPAPVYAAPQQQFWYWCDNPQGYSPYVQACSTPWRQVPAQPVPAPAAPPR